MRGKEQARRRRRLVRFEEQPSILANEYQINWIFLSISCVPIARVWMAFAAGARPSFSMASGIEEPLDLVKLCLDERVFIKMKGDRELHGRLHAFDQHMNMVLGDVEEQRTITSAQNNESTETEKPSTRHFEMLFVRGDSVVLLAPPSRIA